MFKEKISKALKASVFLGVAAILAPMTTSTTASVPRDISQPYVLQGSNLSAIRSAVESVGANVERELPNSGAVAAFLTQKQLIVVAKSSAIHAISDGRYGLKLAGNGWGRRSIDIGQEYAGNGWGRRSIDIDQEYAGNGWGRRSIDVGQEYAGNGWGRRSLDIRKEYAGNGWGRRSVSVNQQFA